MNVLKDFRAQARIEYLEATSYYADRSEAAANRFAYSVESYVKTLHQFPEMGRQSDFHPNIRKLVMTAFPYIIYYKLDEKDRPIILSIFNVYRNPDSLKLD